VTYTHYGWFGFCPVKIGGLDTPAPLVAPRWWWLEPVFWLAEQHESTTIFLRSIFMPDVERLWALRVTRPIKRGE
jgi:hypothetical protein